MHSADYTLARTLKVLLLTTALTLSIFAVFTQRVEAFPFGGQAGVVRTCWNQAIYAVLGPPRGGPYIWTPQTRTYSFGPPRNAGQWLLGNAGAPYFCIVQLQPLSSLPGSFIMMMGSSQ